MTVLLIALPEVGDDGMDEQLVAVACLERIVGADSDMTRRWWGDCDE